MSAAAHVLQNRIHRRQIIINEALPLEQEEKPDETLEQREQAIKNKAARALKITALKKNLKINDTIAALLSMLGIFFALLEYEDYFRATSDKSHNSATAYGNVLRSFVSLSTLILIVFLFSHSRICYQLHKEKHPIKYHATYTESKYFKFFIAEAFINGIHNPPGVDLNFSTTQLDYTFEYSLDLIFTTWMLLRVYLVFRLFAEYSKWTGPVAESCCEPEGCEANTIFAIKAVLKDKPYTTIFIVMLASIIIFGLAVRNFERPLYYGNEGQSGFQDYSYIWNGMWLIAVTMTTGN